MKKISLIAILFAATLFAGCGDKVQELKDTKNNISSKVEEGKSLVGGLKDAMKNGVTMKCTGDDEDGTWVTYTNGKNFRTEVTTEGKQQRIIMKDNVSYVWEKDAKTGIKMDKKCMEDFQKSLGIDIETFEDDNFGFTSEDLEAEEAEGKAKCSPSTDADFSVPSDINFTDQCEMLKKQMGQAKAQIPGNFK